MADTPLVAGFTVDWSEVGPAEAGAWGRWKFMLNSTYARMASSAGVSPAAVLPCGVSELRKVLAGIDILVMTGGNDPDPALYGRSADGCGRIDYQRPRWEMALYREALGSGVPVLGICLGMQTIAIAEGSALIRDIPSFLGEAGIVDHHGLAASPREHGIAIGGGLLRELYGSGRIVSSFHHQAVEEAPEGFSVVARAPDGIIEAMESRDGLVLGVQWHPERDGSGIAILKALAARRGRRS